MKYEVNQFKNIPYIIRYPNGYSVDKNYPVLLFLHGAGGRGDIDAIKNGPCFQLTEKYTEFPFIMIAPVCCANTWYDLFQTLEEFVYEILSFKYTDKQKLYLMGASMGGYATWQLAMSMPECFAAIVPICGGGMYWNAGRLLNVPVWAFHGKKDTIVLPMESEKMVNAVNLSGGNARLTLYPENAHDAWSDTLNNPTVFEWLLTHQNNNSIELKDIYHGTKLYG